MNGKGRVDMNFAESDRPLVLPLLHSWHTFVVTSIMMHILTARGLFVGLLTDDPHDHIPKMNVVCKSCIGRPNWDMNVIGMRTFPLSLTGDVVVWFNELPYNSIYQQEQLTEAFLAKLFAVSKKFNKKDKLNNFVFQPGESVSRSWDRFIAYNRSIPSLYIDYYSLKEYFYWGRTTMVR